MAIAHPNEKDFWNGSEVPRTFPWLPIYHFSSLK
jgi:hypothetical protein